MRAISCGCWLLAGLLPALCLANASKPGDMQTAAEDASYRLYLSSYNSDDGTAASDLNFRANFQAHTVWLGYYQDSAGFDQARTGYEYNLFPAIGHIVLSTQAATQGFAGGSINSELGHDYTLLLGFGRTNLKPYFNLNFDPNDSVTYGVGTHAIPGWAAYLFAVQDNRENPDQRHAHLLVRQEIGNGQSWSFDILQKTGKVNDAYIAATGATFTYDFGKYFLRIADDPYTNFSAQHMVRGTLGILF